MNTTPNGKATESDDVSIVPADEKHAHAYEQTAAAEYQITRADEQRVTKYTSDPKAIETNDAWIARTDERLAHAYEQIARDREQLAWITEQLSRLEHDAGRNRSAVLDRRPLRGGSALRGLIGLLLAACIFAAAFASQSSYGGAAKQIIARWAPPLVWTSSLPPNKPGLAAAQPSPAAPQVAAAQPMPSTPSAQTAPQELGPTAAPLSPELAQRLQTMASDLANVEREIEQLKTSQVQVARDNASAIEQLKASEKQTASDNAKAIEQFKASQEQMADLIASEQNLRPKTTAPPSRPTVASTRKPVQPSPQGRVQP